MTWFGYLTFTVKVSLCSPEISLFFFLHVCLQRLFCDITTTVWPNKHFNEFHLLSCKKQNKTYRTQTLKQTLFVCLCLEDFYKSAFCFLEEFLVVTNIKLSVIDINRRLWATLKSVLVSSGFACIQVVHVEKQQRLKCVHGTHQLISNPSYWNISAHISKYLFMEIRQNINIVDV